MGPGFLEVQIDADGNVPVCEMSLVYLFVNLNSSSHCINWMKSGYAPVDGGNQTDCCETPREFKYTADN